MRTASDLTARFTEQAQRASSTVHRLAGWSDVADLGRRLAAGGRVALPPALASDHPEVVTALGDQALVPSGDDPAAAVADAEVGIVRGELAVAETGSVLQAEDALADRVVSMLSRALVQVVMARDVVERLEAAAEALAAKGPGPWYASLVTGPSRTADIERSLTIGVQGPDEVHVVLLEGLS